MKKLKSIFMIIIINTLIIVGCTNDENIGKNDISSDNNINKYIVNKLDENQNNIIKEESGAENNEKDKVDIQLITMDVNTSEPIPLGNVSIDKNNDIEENLELVIDKISELKFDDAPIELLKIENSIAYIDIRESDDKNYWSSNYFQGSTGARITSFTLVENILQRNYKGEWIDGIYLTYEGKTDVEFDHLDMDFFGNVISR